MFACSSETINGAARGLRPIRLLVAVNRFSTPAFRAICWTTGNCAAVGSELGLTAECSGSRSGVFSAARCRDVFFFSAFNAHRETMSNLESSDSATRSDLECDPCQGQLAFTGHSSLRADARLGIRRYFKSDFQALICKVEKKRESKCCRRFFRLSGSRMCFFFHDYPISVCRSSSFSSRSVHWPTRSSAAMIDTVGPSRKTPL